MTTESLEKLSVLRDPRTNKLTLLDGREIKSLQEIASDEKHLEQLIKDVRDGKKQGFYLMGGWFIVHKTPKQSHF